MTRGNKGRDPDFAEKWAPGRTLHSIAEMRLTAEDISEAVLLIDLSDDQSRANLTDELQSVAMRYWEQHRDAQQPPADWYRTKVGRIQKEAENLLKLLREPKGTAVVQLRYQTERRMGLRLLGSRQEPPSIEQLLDDFVDVCKSCSFLSARGAPKKVPIKTAVASLREVWIKFTGREFPLNLVSADNRRDRDGRPAAEQDRDDAFTSPGPRFVQVMMRRIDPTVGIGAIGTALREAAVNARGVD